MNLQQWVKSLTAAPSLPVLQSARRITQGHVLLYAAIREAITSNLMETVDEGTVLGAAGELHQDAERAVAEVYQLYNRQLLEFVSEDGRAPGWWMKGTTSKAAVKKRVKVLDHFIQTAIDKHQDANRVYVTHFLPSGTAAPGVFFIMPAVVVCKLRGNRVMVDYGARDRQAVHSDHCHKSWDDAKAAMVRLADEMVDKARRSLDAANTVKGLVKGLRPRQAALPNPVEPVEPVLPVDKVPEAETPADTVAPVAQAPAPAPADTPAESPKPDLDAEESEKALAAL